MNNETTEQNMAPQNSTLINLINDDVKSITSERLSPIKKEVNSCSSNDDEVCLGSPFKTPCLYYVKISSN